MKEEYTYILKSTGVGSGTLWNENDLFSSSEEAQNECDIRNASLVFKDDVLEKRQMMQKEILSTDERISKTNQIIDDYYKRFKNELSLRQLIHDLLDVYNQSVHYRNEETIMSTWVANYPDH